MTLTARTNFILVVHPKLGVDSVEAFVALAKAHPKTLNYGSAGSGSLIHIATELFNTTMGIETNHVPYKGLAPAVNDLLAGQIDFMFNSATTMSHIQAGRLKALAVIGPNPLPALPQLKTLAAYGIMGVDVASGWHASVRAGRHAAEIIDRLNAALQPILASAALKERIISLGAEPASSTPDQLAKILANDLERLAAHRQAHRRKPRLNCRCALAQPRRCRQFLFWHQTNPRLGSTTRKYPSRDARTYASRHHRRRSGRAPAGPAAEGAGNRQRDPGSAVARLCRSAHPRRRPGAGNGRPAGRGVRRRTAASRRAGA